MITTCSAIGETIQMRRRKDAVGVYLDALKHEGAVGPAKAKRIRHRNVYFHRARRVRHKIQIAGGVLVFQVNRRRRNLVLHT